MIKFSPSPGCRCTYCTRLPLSPEQYHVSAKHRGDFEQCQRCERGRQVCQQKKARSSRREAQEAAQVMNERSAYQEPAKYYRCRYCLLWHLTHVKGKRARKRVEKARRHWLVKEKYGDTNRHTVPALRGGDPGDPRGSGSSHGVHHLQMDDHGNILQWWS